jgi:hypothetical protein
LRKALRILAILIGVLSFVTAMRFAFAPQFVVSEAVMAAMLFAAARTGEHDDGSVGRGRDRGEELG